MNPYQEKTPAWWFTEHLPEPYKSQALKNIKWNHQCNSLEEALWNAFDWDRGNGSEYDYWEDLHSRIQKGEFRLPVEQHPTPQISKRIVTETRVVMQEWYETELTKTGWDSHGWRFCDDGTEMGQNWEIQEHLSTDKHYNPTQGIATRNVNIYS